MLSEQKIKVFLKHPLTVALFSGILLLILTYVLESNRVDQEKRDFAKKASYDKYEKYLDEFSLAATNFYSAVENYILDMKEFKKVKFNNSYEERIWRDIQQINFARAPLYAALEKIKISKIVTEKEFVILIQHAIDISTLCQTRRNDRLDDIRKLLDTEFTPKKNEILYKIQQGITKIQQE